MCSVIVAQAKRVKKILLALFFRPEGFQTKTPLFSCGQPTRWTATVPERLPMASGLPAGSASLASLAAIRQTGIGGAAGGHGGAPSGGNRPEAHVYP
jgi:hypothetical protein